MDAHVVWQKELAFTGSEDSGYAIQLGKEHGGASPLELVLTGLAGCTASDVISILQKKRQDVTAFQVHAHAERAAEHPKVFTHVLVEYIITGRNLELAAAERAVELSVTKYCPAINMLNKAVDIQTKITLVPAD